MNSQATRADINAVITQLRGAYPNLAFSWSISYGWVCREQASGRRAAFPNGLTSADLDDWVNATCDQRVAAQAPPAAPTSRPRGAMAGAGGGYGAIFSNAVDRYAGPAAIYTGYNAFRGAMSYGGQAGESLATGAMAIPRTAFDVGTRIGNMILEGVMQPFGQSGAAVSRLGNVVTGSIERLANGAGGALSGLAKTGGAVAGGVLAGGMVVAGGAIGAMFGPPGMLIGAAIGAGIAQGVMKAVAGLANMVSGVLGSVATVFGELGKVGVEALKSLVDVVKDTVNEAVASSRAMLSLSQQTGRGLGASATSVYNAGAFGIGANALPQGNAMLSGITAQMYGGDGSGSRSDLNAYRRFYQNAQNQGPVGLMFAQTIESQNGRGAFRGMANLSDAQFSRQMDRSQTMQSAFGMRPEQIKEAAQNWTLLTASASQFAELTKQKFAVELMPYLTRAFDGGIEYLTKNSGKITEGIKKSVSWLIETLPPMAMRAGAMVLRGFSGALQIMGQVASAAPKVWSTINKGAQSFFKNATSLVSKIGASANAMMSSFSRGATSAMSSFSRGATSAARTILGVFGQVERSVRAIGESAFFQRLMSLAKSLGVVTDTAKDAAKKAGLSEDNSNIVALGVGALALNAIRRAPGAIVNAVMGRGAGGGFLRGALNWAQRGFGAARNFVTPGGAGFSPLQRLMMPRAFGPQFTGRGLLAAVKAPVVALGVGLGVFGYEKMRQHIPGFAASHASTRDIASYLYQRAAGNSDTQIRASAIRNARAASSTRKDGKSDTPTTDALRRAFASGARGANDFGTSGFDNARTWWSDAKSAETARTNNNGAFGRGADVISRWSSNVSSTANAAADKLDKMADGWSNYVKSVDQIAINTGNTAKTNSEAIQILNLLARNTGPAMIARISSYIAEDAAIANLSS